MSIASFTLRALHFIGIVSPPLFVYSALSAIKKEYSYHRNQGRNTPEIAKKRGHPPLFYVGCY